MADLVLKDSVGYKRRNPWGVFFLTLITGGIYYLVWYYKVNNELRNVGSGKSPGMSLLAVTLGVVILVPPLVSIYRTADRIRVAQEQAGAKERMSPMLGLLGFVVVSYFILPYYQSQANKIWDAYLELGGELAA